MFPTSSSTFLVGKNARSATVLINDLSFLPGSALPHSRLISRSLRQEPRGGQLGTVGCALVAWYVQRALSALWVRRSGLVAVIAAPLLLGACGGQRQDVSEPHANFTVAVTKASFPTSQRLSEHTHLVIAVRNAGNSTIPDVAVTITNPQAGTAAQALSEFLPQTEANTLGLASRSRPVWIVDHPPGLCGYSCESGGPGGAVTAYTNTWALGALKPGDTATFNWGVTAVKSGSYTVQYEVAAGLNGKARAFLSDGNRPRGRIHVSISTKPAQSYVNGSGKIITTP